MGWAVGRGGLGTFQIRFSEAVIVSDGSVTLRGIDAGDIPVTVELDPTGLILTVSPDELVPADILMLVIDYTITDLAGNALDGEAGEPLMPSFPTGNGRQGGQTVIRINSLQGDVSRDGMVDAFDAMELVDSFGLGEGDPEFNPRADLNSDGLVNVLDVTILIDGLGGVLPVTDGDRPTIVGISPDPAAPLLADVGQVVLTFDEPVDASTLSPRGLYAVNFDDTLTPAASVELSPDGLVATFTFTPPLVQCDRYDIGITQAIGDLSGEGITLAPEVELDGRIPPPAPQVDPVVPLTTDPTADITGAAPAEADRVQVIGPGGSVTVPVVAGRYAATLDLAISQVNRIDVIAISPCDIRSAPRRVEIRQDRQPPNIFVDFPVDGARIEADTTDVAGRVSDRLAGFAGLTVLVNGREAEVDIGIGTNGTFFLPSLELSTSGSTEIVVEATDSLGSTGEKRITVERVEIPPDVPQMAIAAGNGQSGRVDTRLAEPIIIRMLRGDGMPFEGKIITFDVTRSNGRLSATPTDPGSMTVQVVTNDIGFAEVYWTLGSDAGCGNNRVEVSSRDIAGTIVFCASAEPAPASQINIGSGNNQRAETGSPAPDPLRVWVSDSCNGVAGESVTFNVVRGGGLVNGHSTVTLQTGDTGHASVNFELGSEPGNQVVEAVLSEEQGGRATFVVVGLEREFAAPTTMTGLALNNASQPIGGAETTLEVGGVVVSTTTTDEQGRFAFPDVPGSGPGVVHIDGFTATSVGGDPIPEGSYPAIGFDVVLVPGAENGLPMPALLPPLDPANVRSYSTTDETVLEIEGVEGLKMFVAPGSMTLADGTPAPTGTSIALNQVHHDDIPMPMPDGAAPPFAWTLQPAGATFDPPIRIEYPNMSALPPGSIAYFLTFDHDTHQFDIVASGSVTDDGEMVVTDPGSGLTLAGWGCNCPPYSVTGECKDCKPKSNGCGPAFLGGGSVLTDCMLGGSPIFCASFVCFTEACNFHDQCWGACHSSSQCSHTRSSCDEEFYRRLQQTCDSTFPGLSCVGPRLACRARAWVYYQLVSSFTGNKAYRDAQQIACDCCDDCDCQGQPKRTAPPPPPYVDSDGDLLPDDWEFDWGLDPFNPFDAEQDNDADTLINLVEFLHSLDPFLADSDGDGIADAAEVEAIQPILPTALDEAWSISVNGQPAEATSLGTYTITNVAAADSFGPAGPGSAPDFLSDDFLRVTGTADIDGTTWYAFSEPFQIRQGETFVVGDLTITDIPPPLPEKLRLSAADPVLSDVTPTTQLTAIGTLGDGSELDVTERAAWTVYRTSNPDVVSVGPDGLVTAEGRGFAFLTAVNEGATAVTRVAVSLGDPLTTVQGFVKLEDGDFVVGADISIDSIPGAMAISGDGGFFSIPDVPTELIPELVVRARFDLGGGSEVFGVTTVLPDPGMVTDAGIIEMSFFGSGHGPIVASGNDPEDHLSTGGNEMIRDLLFFAVENSGMPHDPPQVALLGGNSAIANIYRNQATALGYELVHIVGTAIDSMVFSDYDMIQMPTSASEVTGGLSSADLARINARGVDLREYVNFGGGVVAFAQEGSGAFEWFPLGGLETADIGAASAIMLSNCGGAFLSPSAIGVEPFHVVFTGPPDYFGLCQAATEGDGDERPLVIGGVGTGFKATGGQAIDWAAARRKAALLARRPAHGLGPSELRATPGIALSVASIEALPLNLSRANGRPFLPDPRRNNHGQSIRGVKSQSGEVAAIVEADGSIRPLGTLGGANSRALAINDAGQVVGWSETASGEIHAFRYTPTLGMEDLGTLGGEFTTAVALNESGHTAGFGDIPAGVERPFLLTDAAFVFERGLRHVGPLVLPFAEHMDPSQIDARALAISADGRMIAGMVFWDAGPHDETSRAIVWAEGSGLVDLNWLLEQSGVPEVEDGWRLISAEGFDAGGAIIGRGVLDGQERAFRLVLRMKANPDRDGDGFIDVTEVAQFMAEFGAGDPAADMTGDGVVDVWDVFEVLQSR